MAIIEVELSASYGCNCMGGGYGSEETIEVEVSEQELEALQRIDADQITVDEVVEAIESGETVLKSLHEKLEEQFYYMVEEYWLFEADNECLEECLAEHIEQDIKDGLYIPEPPAISTPEVEDESDCEDCEDDENDDWDDEDDDWDDEDEESEYDLDAYHEWVCGNDHDHEFIAERVGLDLYACREDEVFYTITISE